MDALTLAQELVAVIDRADVTRVRWRRALSLVHDLIDDREQDVDVWRQAPPPPDPSLDPGR